MKSKNTQTAFFTPTKKAAANPYIGFTSYQRFRGDPLFADIVVRPENNLTETERTECYPVSSEAALMGGGDCGFYPDTEVAYIRILWKDFEPRRKEYNYPLIADILKRAKEKKQTVMFRLMPHSTRATDDVPEWLKEVIPCPERPEGKRVKDSPTDSLWLSLFGEAIEAIGRQFDADPTLDVVDLSLTGAWGEGHRVAEYPKEALQALADAYSRAFPHTRLIGQVAAPWLADYLSLTHPCGWRGDGTGEPKHMNVMYPAAAAAMPDLWKKAPVSFESYWWLGEWERHGWDIGEIIEKTLSWHISTFNGKSFPIPEAWREKVEYWLGRMGYHFVLSEATYPTEGEAGKMLPFTLKVLNRGVAPIYAPIPLRVGLFGEKDYFITTDVDPRAWLPGEREVTFEITLPDDIPAGRYAAVITLSGEDTPVVKWENEEMSGDFLPLGQVEIKGESALPTRGYLTEFLEEFGYADEAKRTLLSAYDLLFSDEAAVLLFDGVRDRFEKAPDEKFTYLVEASDAIAENCAISRYTVYLLLLILLSKSSKRVYAARGVSEDMWRRNMRDLKYTCDQCLLLKGVYGTDCPLWYGRFFAATKFSFGKMQFELCRLGKECETEGRRLHPDDQAIFIHIPRTGERLLPEDVDAACAAASAFFKQRYGISEVVFACHSWILYPENKKMLSEKSNLYSFISRFTIVDLEEDTSYKEVWRLFDTEYHGDADALPQDTSLRRAYVARIKAKLPLGVALGVWLYRGREE